MGVRVVRREWRCCCCCVSFSRRVAYAASTPRLEITNAIHRRSAAVPMQGRASTVTGTSHQSRVVHAQQLTPPQSRVCLSHSASVRQVAAESASVALAVSTHTTHTLIISLTLAFSLSPLPSTLQLRALFSISSPLRRPITQRANSDAPLRR